MATIDDYLNYKKQIENKPPTAIGSGSNPIFSPNGGQDIMEGPTNRPLGEGASGDVDSKGNVIGQSTRVGDYVYSQGRSYLVPNSVTDLRLKNMVVSGGSKMPNTTSVFNARGTATGAALGAAAGAFGGKLGSAVGAVSGAIAGNIFGSITDTRRAIEEWKKQAVDYDSAVEFFTDDNGKLKYRINYEKMGKGGELSSPEVIKMQNMDTNVALLDNGHLKVTVSPVFANTNYYKSIIKNISENYAGLTKDSDDLDEKLKEIRNYIDGAKKEYLANTIAYAAYKTTFPDASDTALIAGYSTAFAGNADPEDMDKYKVYTVNSDGEIKEQKASDFFDGFLALSMDDRNEAVKRLTEIATKGEPDERAVAYGELQALHAASNNKYKYKDDKYEGMMDAEWLVTFWNQFSLIDNVFLGEGRQEYLNQNEYAENIGVLTSAGAKIALTYAGLTAIGNLMAKVPGTAALYNASLAGEAGQASSILASASQSAAVSAKTIAAGVAFNTLRSALFNAGVSGLRLATGDKFEDVATDFANDLVMDTVIGLALQYFDAVKFQATVTDTTKFVYKDAKTGDIKILNTDAKTGSIVDTGADVDIDGNVIGSYEQIGKMNFAKTSSGVDVGYVTSGDTTLYKYGDSIYVVGKNGATTVSSSDVTGSTPPSAMKTGIVMERGTEISDSALSTAVAEAGLAPGTEILQLPSKDAFAAVAAGKFTKIEGSKVGLKINKAVFNSNAALDYVNDRALAKSGDRTAWQEGNEIFGTIKQVADGLRNDINSGKYYKPIIESKAARIEAFGNFKIKFGKMTKADNNYMKAKESIARAQIAQESLAPEDGVDLVSEALAVNGKYLEGISQERADALDHYVATTKRYIKDFIISVKKSGLADVEQINYVTNSDISRKIGYIPMWGKKESYNSILNQYFLVDQEKRPIKTWYRGSGTVDVKDTMDFVISTDRLMSMFANNMALEYRNKVLAEQLDSSGMLVDNSIGTERQRVETLEKVKNLDDLKGKFKDMVKDAKKLVNKEVPSPKQYKEMMEEAYSEGSIDGAIERYQKAAKKRNAARELAKAEQALYDQAYKVVSESSKYNELFGRVADVDAYNEATLAPNLKKAISSGDRDAIESAIANAQLDIAPYVTRSSVLKSRLDGVADEWRKWASDNIKMPKGTSADKKSLAVDIVAGEINGTTLDGFEMGAAKKAASLGQTYPITYYRNGRPYTRYIVAKTEEERRIAQEIERIINDKQLIMKRGVVANVAKSFANGFRLLTTAFDPSRALPNFSRDTVRAEVTSGGVSFTAKGANKIFKSMIEAGGYSAKQAEQLTAAFDNTAERVGGDTYNKAYGSSSRADKDLWREYLNAGKESAPNKFVRFTYDLKTLGFNALHSPTKILEAPGDFIEGYTRKRLAKSAFVNALREAQLQGKDFKDQLNAAEKAADFAGHEYTANFGRKGQIVGQVAQYVPYFSTEFANIDGFKRAFINNPTAVARNYAVFLMGYLFILADTLSNEKSRRNYYRLTDYDRSNSIIISMDDGTLLTVPLDETLAGMLFPFRRILETMNNVDPVSFYEFVWGTLTEPIPVDMSGFSEGDYFNFRRGVEKLVSSVSPTWATGLFEASTGYDLYYGSSNKVSDEDLKERGIYAPEPGDYTTISKNSATLRRISNATGIPQWQLQTLLSNYGGNVGQYVIGTIDKLSGATEEEQGGKNFFDAIFKSFVATEYDNAASQFYNVVNDLKKDKNKLLQKLSDIKEQEKTASGDALYELQAQRQKAKDDFAVKVGDAVGKYLNAYQITGGLSKSQAMQIYYLFRFDDDDGVTDTGSVGEYFSGLAENAASSEATKNGASVLDKYFDQSAKPYYDESAEEWRIAPTYGESAYYNTIYGRGTKYEVDLRNILEKKGDSFKSVRSQYKDAREAARKAQDWDKYDEIAYEYDKKLIERIAPYITRNGTSDVLTNSTALDYLEDWIMVPSEWQTNKKGKYVSLGHNASKEKAFARPYLKYLFGLDTGAYANYDIEKPKMTIGGQ